MPTAPTTLPVNQDPQDLVRKTLRLVHQHLELEDLARHPDLKRNDAARQHSTTSAPDAELDCIFHSLACFD